MTPATTSHEISIVGQRLSYPAANLAAMVVVALAALGLAVTAMTVAGAARELVVVRRFARSMRACRPRPLGDAWVVPDERPRAFCAGLIRPRVYVSSGAVALLDEPALRAVLAHEAPPRESTRPAPARRRPCDGPGAVLHPRARRAGPPSGGPRRAERRRERGIRRAREPIGAGPGDVELRRPIGPGRSPSAIEGAGNAESGESEWPRRAIVAPGRVLALTCRLIEAPKAGARLGATARRPEDEIDLLHRIVDGRQAVKVRTHGRMSDPEGAAVLAGVRAAEQRAVAEDDRLTPAESAPLGVLDDPEAEL